MKRLLCMLAVIVMFFCLTACSGTVNEECDYCGSSPSVAYKTKSGYGDAHVCKKCSSTCMICDERKATRHYENHFGGVVFVCDSCYSDLRDYS